MSIGRSWAGRIYGTNTGNIFVRFDGEDDSLVGEFRFNDNEYGLAIYNITAVFDGFNLSIQGDPSSAAAGVSLGKLNAKALLNRKGELRGEWQSSVGTAGTFVLFPHDANLPENPEGSGKADQFHTARYDFGAIQIDILNIIRLADDIQKEFSASKVVVTVLTDTEKSRFLEDFKEAKFTDKRARFIKIYAQEPEPNGLNRVVVIEFGQDANFVMTQGTNESWVIGRRETIKREIKHFEKIYSTNIKKIDVNSFIFIFSICFIPELISI